MFLQLVYMTIVLSYSIAFKEDYVLPAILVVAAFLTIVAHGDSNSENAKIQAQMEKQTSIYNQQLKDGILTQEEYDQITKNMK